EILFLLHLEERGSKMSKQSETSGRDETLAIGFYSFYAEASRPQVPIITTHFEYSARPASLLSQVKAKFGKRLERTLPAEHMAVVEESKDLSDEDSEFIERMCHIQRKLLAE